MGDIYVISDLHLGHTNMAIHRGFSSSEEQDALIIKNWNDTVRKGDTVWILGDITMEKKSGYEILDMLKGYKKIVLGNHDMPNHSPELLKYANSVCGMYDYKDVVLSHCPIHPNEVELYMCNIHGHVHENSINDNRYVNVSCEVVNYTPVNLKELIEKTRELLRK